MRSLIIFLVAALELIVLAGTTVYRRSALGSAGMIAVNFVGLAIMGVGLDEYIRAEGFWTLGLCLTVLGFLIWVATVVWSWFQCQRVFWSQVKHMLVG